MTKNEMYNTVVVMVKTTGQGVPGFLRQVDPSLGNILDELVAEGKLDLYIQKYSTMSDDEWYVPKGCYSPFADEKNSMKNLTFVRIYLGLDEPFLNFTTEELFIQHPEYKTEYDTWLEVNKEKLEEMVNWREINETEVVDETTEFTPKEIDWIKSKEWYIENRVISNCLKDSANVGSEEDKQKLGVCKKLIPLYEELVTLKELDNDQMTNFNEAKDYIKNYDNYVKIRNKFNSWCQTQGENDLIQTLI